MIGLILSNRGHPGSVGFLNVRVANLLVSDAHGFLGHIQAEHTTMWVTSTSANEYGFNIWAALFVQFQRQLHAFPALHSLLWPIVAEIRSIAPV